MARRSVKGGRSGKGTALETTAVLALIERDPGLVGLMALLALAPDD